jgi:DNA (cytosine-5)-methyltransferase 1
MLTFGAIAQRYRPRWLVWENVPGVLSSNGGRDFGTFLGMLGELGYGFAYRILDAQYFGLAQRRRRVFVVGCAGSWQRAAAVLFERESLRGNPPPRREAWQKPAPTIAGCANGGGANGPGRDVDSVESLVCISSGQANAEIAVERSPALTCLHEAPIVAHALRGEGFDASEDGTGRGTPLVPVIQPFTLAIRGRGDTHNLEYRQDGTANALLTPNGGRGGIGVGAVAHAFDARQSDVIQYGDKSGPLDTDGHLVAVAFAQNQRDEVRTMDVVGALAAKPGAKQQTYLQHAMHVRRLTPLECERLQGFPDNYTLIPYRNKQREQCPDGPRYKALGNSMAVPVMRWIGERIAMVEHIVNGGSDAR